jgi:exopolyphosphatase/guanosine-5'-triphosphate,3'-diphosphate pyrophosphatase
MPIRAVIDIGTNSVKLLVGDVSDLGVRPLLESSEQTRLGAGFYETHTLQPEAIRRTAAAVSALLRAARERQAAVVRLIATSAAREARNQTELTGAIERETRLPVRVISGELEAQWTFRGVATGSDRGGGHSGPLLVLDVGGGSTEFMLGEGAQLRFCRSVPLGTVRLLEQTQVSNPPAASERTRCSDRIAQVLHAEVGPALLPMLEDRTRGEVRLVGTGGTATILAWIATGGGAFDRARLDGVVLSREAVGALADRLWGMPIEARREIPGLPPNRADVILFGVGIYEAVMAAWELPRLDASARGLRFGALLDG